MARRSFATLLGLSLAATAAGCFSSGKAAMLDGRAILSSLKFAGGPPRGQTEPEITIDDDRSGRKQPTAPEAE
jgi:hypothetical protein